MRCGLVSDMVASLLADPAGRPAAAQRKGDVAVPPRRPRALSDLVADLAAHPPGLALEAGEDIPRLAHLLESLEEGFDPLRRNLDDVVHGCPPVMLLRRSCRPDDTGQPVRKERRVKTQSGASGDLGGPDGGHGHRERVLLMRCAALVRCPIRAAPPHAEISRASLRRRDW